MPKLKVRSLRSGNTYIVFGLSGALFLLWKGKWVYEPIEYYEPVMEG